MSDRKKPSQKKTRKNKKWIARVNTVSTYPPEGLFTKSASTIARTLASKKVSPKGPASGMRMLTYFINRAGRGLSPKRQAELEKAKTFDHIVTDGGTRPGSGKEDWVGQWGWPLPRGKIRDIFASPNRYDKTEVDVEYAARTLGGGNSVESQSHHFCADCCSDGPGATGSPIWVGS